MSTTSDSEQKGALNFFFGGALGALAEASMPHNHKNIDLSKNEQYKVAFYSAVFGTAGKLVQADGVVLDFEIDTVREFIKETLMLSPSWENFALSLFTQAIESTTPVEKYLAQFSQIIKYDNEIGESFINFLVAIAVSDGEVHPNEKELLLSAETSLQLPSGTVAQVLSQYGWDLHTCHRLVDSESSLSRSYALLEIPFEATIDQIESAFRKKTEEFSPQLATTQGLPPEFVKFTNQRFQDICCAYTEIMNKLR